MTDWNMEEALLLRDQKQYCPWVNKMKKRNKSVLIFPTDVNGHINAKDEVLLSNSILGHPSYLHSTRHNFPTFHLIIIFFVKL